MHTGLPIISSAGLFRSRDKFSNPARYPEHAVTRLRTVTSYELELFASDGGISHFNGHSYPIKKGSLLIAQPGDKRQSTLHFTAYYIHFGTDDRIIQELLQTVHGFHPETDYGVLLPSLKEICDTALSFEPDSDIRAAAGLISFLCEFKKKCLMNPSAGNGTIRCSVISAAIEYMKQFYMEPLTVEKIAGHCCLSASHFHRLFSETVHMTPNQYLLKIRLSAARSLLAATTLSVSEIAVKCGFNSQAYFSDCFKRHFAVTPREFRRSYTYPESFYDT